MANEPSPPGAFSHAAATLEFASVLELIAEKCVNRGAADEVRGLRPSADVERIRQSLSQIAETREFQTLHGRLAVVDTSAEAWIRTAVDNHEIVAPEGCLDIAAMERGAGELRRRMEGESDFPLLRSMVDRLDPHTELVAMIDEAIDRDATIKDTASPKLKSLRRQVRNARDDLRKHSEMLARSFGADEMATFTGTRHVLLVPREKCRRSEGLVHSASHSGGSLYFEPFSLVEKNNALETFVHDERAECARILSALTASIVEAAPGLLENVRVWEELDALSATARFSEAFDCTTPEFSLEGGDRSAGPSVIKLAGARHPLLEMSLRREGGGRSTVPLNLSMTAESPLMVITGPNAGGKTVTLKTVGLLVLMFQSGLPIPAREGSELPVFESVHADIGDEQSIASSLSTFTSHLRHLDNMCRSATGGSLCLVDEIGDGTDPDEGAALAIATLEHLKKKAGFVIATTHYGRVKMFALTSDGVINASMAFDDDNDTPLYRLLQGTAGRSRGLETARRMGFEPRVVRQAETLIGEDAFRLENVLSELESTLLALERERAALRAQSETLNKLIATYDAKDKAFSEFADEHREKVRREIEATLLDTRKELESLVKRIRETRAEKKVVRETHGRIRKMLNNARAKPKTEPKPVKAVSPGDMVSLSPSGQPRGRVIEVAKQSATVDINGKKISVRVSDLYRVEEEPGGGEEPVRRPAMHTPIGIEPLHTTTVDVRGLNQEEALEEVDRFLDRAVLSGVREITIIHGIGEGVLQQAVRERLRGDPRVESSRQGLPGEGGMGVTVVGLK